MITSFVSSRTIRRATKTIAATALLGFLQAPLHAQLPVIPLSQHLTAEESEKFTDGTPHSVTFGEDIAYQAGMALVQLSGYPDDPRKIGRVAWLTTNDDGAWVRRGSIDPANGQDGDAFGSPLALHGQTALIGSKNGMHVYRESNAQWTQIQHLPLQTPWRFTDAVIEGTNAFLATELNGQGEVYAYRVQPDGRLTYLQTLRSGVDFDYYAERLGLSENRLIVSAVGDNGDRGAAHVFELRGNRWVKQQKLVAPNGAPTDMFGASVAIWADTIAVGAPNVAGRGDQGCFGGANSGAIYMFRLINGRWEYDNIVRADDLQSTSECVHIGRQVVLNSRWMAASLDIYHGFSDSTDTVVFQDEDGVPQTYVPFGIARAGNFSVAQHLSEGQLFTGFIYARGCETENVCFGDVNHYNLDRLFP